MRLAIRRTHTRVSLLRTVQYMSLQYMSLQYMSLQNGEDHLCGINADSEAT